MKSDFEIPFDVKNDLAYCKRALHHHIAMFQVNVTITFIPDFY